MEENQPIDFNEEQIQALFGHEAAENEDPDRLLEYFLKGDTYAQIANDLPIRLLVGHKGTGKSALFQVAREEDLSAKRVALIVRPDDIASLACGEEDFLQSVRIWKEGLTEILAKKALTFLGLGFDQETVKSKLARFGGQLLDVVLDSLNGPDYVDSDAANRSFQKLFVEKSEITVYIDDLDRGWKGRPQDVARISALLNAVRDLSIENRGLRFRISLRSDVYYLVRTSDESTDKIEGSVVWNSWSQHEIFVLLVTRIQTYLGTEHESTFLLAQKQETLSKYLQPIMEERFRGKGKWANIPVHRLLLSLVRNRPRDLVKLCTLAAKEARRDGATKIGTKQWESVFEEYSNGRMQDTINEYKSELPEVERLLLNMRPTKRELKESRGFRYTTAELLHKISTIEERGRFRFNGGKAADKKDLAAFLYKTDFVTATKISNPASSYVHRKHFESHRYLSSRFVDFGYDWEVHPAYRWALQGPDLDQIYRQLELTGEDPTFPN